MLTEGRAAEGRAAEPQHLVPMIRSVARWLPWLLILLGVAVRLRQYAFHRSLWLDEAYLALNIVHFDFSRLAGQLNNGQTAPLGYLWAVKSSFVLLGNNEYALRFPALIAGLATLPLAYAVARRLLSPVGVCLAVLFVAFSPALIYYSDETKPYGVDAFAVVLIVWATARFTEGEMSRRRAVVWGATLGATSFFSYPALFAVAAAAGAVLLSALVRKDHRRMLVVTATGVAVCATMLAIVYVTSLRVAQDNAPLREMWRAGYVPLPLRPKTYGAWLHDITLGMLHNPVGLRLPWLALLLLVTGYIVIARRRLPAGAALLLVPAVALMAASVQAYPALIRFILFLAPVAFLLLAAAPDAAFALRRSPAVRTTACAVMTLAMIPVAGPGMLAGGRIFAQPVTRIEARQVYEAFSTRWRPGEGVALHVSALPTYRYYAKPLGVPEDAVVSMVDRQTCDDEAELAKLRRFDHVWVIFAHILSSEPNQIVVYRSRLDRLGTATYAVRGAGGAVAILYDTRRPPAAPPDPLPAFRPNQCLGIQLR